ncbi:hypothetical protein CEUSTIGMA_g4572.t1 [Chlamydomonas eustigma]|uniref:FAD synthase n=1 Tax=Chlamydomonas eustigma TaxID=1157962 RepID=A0A250X248_9CHLO|nr:hypothetical protein CEUSTIGMA_g4572.t1 [Chlamydomonas eustigma]|eukprot:GAX77126.1 hypothetical protein CEUSTIGMA_g4572.t1 [Chlamydomonas eustigma]
MKLACDHSKHFKIKSRALKLFSSANYRPRATKFQDAPKESILHVECSSSNWRSPLTADGEVHATVTRIVVALGKFDSMHLGHRALAVQAAIQLGGTPCLLSFSGMAEVLGWPKRLPLVAPCDRPRVLKSWEKACGGKIPRQRTVPFKEIRGMMPEEFVQVLAQDLGASGVVAGVNYRFGYKAAGDAEALKRLCQQYNMAVSIVDLVQDEEEKQDSLHLKALQSLPKTVERLQEIISPPCGYSNTNSASSVHKDDSIKLQQTNLMNASAISTQSQDTKNSADLSDLTCNQVRNVNHSEHLMGFSESSNQISSSKVRALLSAGEVQMVSRLLGRCYRLVIDLVHTLPLEEYDPESNPGSGILAQDDLPSWNLGFQAEEDRSSEGNGTGASTTKGPCLLERRPYTSTVDSGRGAPSNENTAACRKSGVFMTGRLVEGSSGNNEVEALSLSSSGSEQHGDAALRGLSKDVSRRYGGMVLVPSKGFLNMAPGAGLYEASLSILYRRVKRGGDLSSNNGSLLSGSQDHSCDGGVPEAESVRDEEALLQTIPLEMESGVGLPVHVRLSPEGIYIPEDAFSVAMAASVPQDVTLCPNGRRTEMSVASAVPLFVVLDFWRLCDT